jgi:predicted enzyme related to lactoylglutathione lyase
MGNPVTWFEINGPEPEQTAKFYSELFGWSIQSMPEANYTLIDTHAGDGVNGGLAQTREGQPTHSVFYAENPDIQALLDRAESMGAKTVVPVTDVPDMVTFAQFTDPFGNLVGLVQGDGSTKVSAGDNPPVDWFELTCSEPVKAWDFYRDLFGWDIKGDETEQFVYGQIDTGGGIRGGIGGSPDGQPHATLYASVDDLQKYLERAESLGGKAVMQPMKVDEHTSIALFTDPQGTTFGMYATQD